jgi:hypothetical protein
MLERPPTNMSVCYIDLERGGRGKEDGTVFERLLLYPRHLYRRERLVGGRYLLPECDRLRGDFRGLTGEEGTKRLLLQGRITGRAVAFVSDQGEFEELEEKTSYEDSSCQRAESVSRNTNL